jgi:ferredoxin
MANLKEYPRNRAGSKIGKIVIDRDLCIGAASCIAVSAETYELDSENKVVVKGPDAVDDDVLIMSAESCPTKAILLFDKSGKQIFPK